MLPIPNLDDRFFDEIVEEARMMIPTYMPKWTDQNEHDPGIMLIELLAWLIEMQQYYMNRIAERSEINFLKLLGIELKPASSAKVEVSIDGVHKEMILPKRTKFLAQDVIFETEESFTLVPTQVEKVIVRTGTALNDYSSLNDNTIDSFYAFGAKPLNGNTMFIGFDHKFKSNRELTLSIDLVENYPVPLGEGSVYTNENGDSIIPSGKISWKYYGERNGKKGWYPLEVIEDGTIQLAKSGKLKVNVPHSMSIEMIHPANDKGRYWFSCTLEDASYELSPRIKRIQVNKIPLIHSETLSETYVFDTTGEKNVEIQLSDYLSFYEKIIVQVKDENGYWRIWNEVQGTEHLVGNDYVVFKDDETKTTTLRFGDGKKGNVLPQGKETVRVICYAESFEPIRFLGASNGLPNQRFELYNLDPIPQTFQLQIGKKVDGSTELVWEDWYRVDDFMNSNASDLHFVYDEKSEAIIFGNNEKGAIPEASTVNNICIVQCQIGGGSKGNIKQHSIESIFSEDEEAASLKVRNDENASGGREKETIEEAKLRFQQQLKVQERAVTAEDFEQIVKRTPGVRVARVKALPLYTVGLKDYPNNKVPAQVTIVVVPYSESPKPIPSEGFLKTIKNYVDKHRLITTEVHVIPPEYIKITVYAVVVVEPYVKDEKKIVEKLNQLFHPLDSDGNEKGWEFGKTVYKGDIYGFINEIEGVSFVKDLWIDGEGRGIQKEASGNIVIPPHGLIYSGQHQIEIVSRTDL